MIDFLNEHFLNVTLSVGTAMPIQANNFTNILNSCQKSESLYLFYKIDELISAENFFKVAMNVYNKKLKLFFISD